MESTTTPSPMSTTPSSNETEMLRSMELDDKSFENELNDGQDTPPVQNKSAPPINLQEKLENALKIVSPTDKIARIKKQAHLNAKKTP